MKLLVPLSIVGDGLAGLMLAKRLQDVGHPLVVYGDKTTNTPPVGLVHLFAGRTFRRSALELAAFERAVEFWRQEPLAQEFAVHRRVHPDDRLDRSARDHDVPAAYAPRRCQDGWLEYGPGFSIAAQPLQARLLQQLSDRDLHRHGRVTPDSLPAPRVLALGMGAAQWLPAVKWDNSHGRTVEATPPVSPQVIRIGDGLHIAPVPGTDRVSLGGRTSPLAGPLNDELPKALELTGLRHQKEMVWSGSRCAPAADRRPVVGWLDEQNFAFFGFGSRASVLAPLLLGPGRAGAASRA